MLGVFNTQFFAALDQLIKVLVSALSANKHIVIENKIEAGAVADQHFAVSIQNIAAGGLHPSPSGKGGGIVNIASGLDHLHIIKR